ncbi:unnamed protein product [Ectocarpus sp. 13 AM-2016]
MNRGHDLGGLRSELLLPKSFEYGIPVDKMGIAIRAACGELDKLKTGLSNVTTF